MGVASCLTEGRKGARATDTKPVGMPNSSPVSRAVRALYEAYPYPPRAEGAAADPYLDLILSYRGAPRPEQPTFLDAGCGTGLNVLGGALLYPHFQVYGLDFNAPAFERIERDAQKFSLKNLALQRADLLELPEDFGPEAGFDIIYCTGVLHHTSDPQGILNTLTRRLHPQGVLRLSVYGSLGRQDLYRFADAAAALYPPGDEGLPTRLHRARALMQSLEQAGHRAGVVHPPLRGPWAGALQTEDAEFADRYLNPHDAPYSIPQLRALLETAGLQLLGWFEPRQWDLDSLLPELDPPPGPPLEPWERYRLVDLLFDRPLFDLYACKPNFSRPNGELTPESALSPNPQLTTVVAQNRGVPLSLSAHLRLGEAEPLERHDLLLLQALPTSGESLQSLQRRGSLGDELPMEAWLERAEALLEREYLFLAT